MHKLLITLSMSCLMTIVAAPALAQTGFAQPGVTSDYPPTKDPSPYDPPPIVCVTYPCELDPTDPEPTDPEPTNPEPQPPIVCVTYPCELEPTDLEPTDLEPTDPELTDPEPTPSPEPTDPESTDPESTPSPEPAPPSGGGEEDGGNSGGGVTGGGGKMNNSSPNMLFGGDFPDNPGEDSPTEAASDPEAQQPAGKAPIKVGEMPATEDVASNLSSSNSGVGGIGVLLALVGLSAAGFVASHQIRSKLNPTIPSKPGIEGNSTSNEVIERATGASADAVESFSSARTATKAAGATSGGDTNVPGDTAIGAQPIDTSSDPVLAAWIPGKHIRLLIADDEPVVRSNLRDMLESQSDFEVVGEAATGVEAVELADRLHPKVVLTDLHMPEMDGVAASARIRSRHSDTYTLVTTYEDGDADIARAIEAGATGYLLKDAPREEVFEIIRATAQGKTTNTNQ